MKFCIHSFIRLSFVLLDRNNFKYMPSHAFEKHLHYFFVLKHWSLSFFSRSVLFWERVRLNNKNVFLDYFCCTLDSNNYIIKNLYFVHFCELVFNILQILKQLLTNNKCELNLVISLKKKKLFIPEYIINVCNIKMFVLQNKYENIII